MIKNTKYSAFFIASTFIFFIKLLTILIKKYFFNSELLQNIGTANGIFSKAASDFPNFLDYMIVIAYTVLLIAVYKFDWVLKHQYIKNVIYFSCFILSLLTISTSIVFQEYRGWDLSLYCVTDISESIRDQNQNIYDFEYQKIKPGLSPFIWLIYNKICNFNIAGFTYLNNYFWIQMLFGVTIVLSHFKFSILEGLCLSTGLNLSMLHMVRTGNYGYLLAIVMAVSLRNLIKGKNINLNIFLLCIVSFFKIQYLIVVGLFIILNETKFKKLITTLYKLIGLYAAFFSFQILLFRKAFTDYIDLMISGYLTNELNFESGITNPVTSQFISRFFNINLNISTYITIFIILIGVVALKSKSSKYFLATSIFNRNKSYDSNYLLVALENRFVTEFIFAFCFVPSILFTFGSQFSLGPLSELLYIPGLFYVVFLSNKKS